MNPATATRQEIRSFVEANSLELRKFAEQGGNPHQLSLDQKDRLEADLASLTHEERDRFYSIYIEEMNANTAHMMVDVQNTNDQTFQTQMQMEKDEQAGYAWLIAVVVMILVSIFVFLK